MRFLIDQNLPTRLIGVLRELGHEAEHVKLLRLATASDRDIWSLATTMSAVVISKDKDFITLAKRQGSARFVHLEIGNLPNDALFLILRRAWPDVIARLQAGEPLVEVRP